MSIAWSVFTPVSAGAGGLLIGAAAVLLMAGAGRIAGISGILGGLLPPERGGMWRLAFLIGLFAAPWLYRLGSALPPIVVEAGTARLIVAGLLVGIGTRYASGCTSGHGVLRRVARIAPVADRHYSVHGRRLCHGLCHAPSGRTLTWSR